MTRESPQLNVSRKIGEGGRSKLSEHESRREVVPTVQILADLAACGVAQERLIIAYNDEIQAYSVTIGAQTPPLTDPHLERLAHLHGRALHIAFERAEDQSRFHNALHELIWREARSAALVWLAEHDLLRSLPVYNPSAEDLAAYACRLETHCGLEPGASLQVISPTALTLHRWFETPADGLFTETEPSKRLRHAVEGSNLGDHGVRLVILGGSTK